MLRKTLVGVSPSPAIIFGVNSFRPSAALASRKAFWRKSVCGPQAFRRSLGLSPPANLPEGAINRGRDLLLGEAEVLSPDAMPDPIAKGHN